MSVFARLNHDPSFQKKRLEALAKVNADPTFQARRVAALRKEASETKWRTEQFKRLNANPKFNEKREQALRIVQRTQEYRDHVKQSWVGAIERKKAAAIRFEKTMSDPIIAARTRAAASAHMKYLHSLPEFQEATRARGRQRAKDAFRKAPTWPEARFYGLIFGIPSLAVGFLAQQSDGHGIYDGAWRQQKIVVELDGGGHHAFKDRHADDQRKDIARLLEGNTVLRETDENVLFLKALAILEGH